ncbi:MAG: 4Fe-4S cluster-binding domain-containing protein [Clostridiales bacterium]|nr:4Fe-4S cluster-binding domain-containing protein [Clostridiales bacterium]MBS5878102.1 4Fe-4S cluster-binding domain-containing protein [Clostridiales bacterium]MDU0939334.1 radical SAM protein [Clostridiales bacterium]MDU1042234.1 radical SAM protein [Clostridiales bacterium]
MKIIQEPDKAIMQVLGKGKADRGHTCRFLKWVVKVPYDGGCLLHNYLTGEMIFFDEADNNALEAKAWQSLIRNGGGPGYDLVRHMIENYFLVREEHDDIKLIDQVRKVIRLIKRPKEVNSFKILPTTNCNARCYYCYEDGINKINMTEDTAHKVVDYIAGRSNGSRVTLAWFGGEPLMGRKVIETICAGLRSRDVEYGSIMTSNGYIFDEELADQAVNSWKLNNIQITLDGTRFVYNRIKDYINPKHDPYLRVINNIRLLLARGVYVNVRLNMGLDNYDDLNNLIDDLAGEFKGQKKFSVYVDGLFQEMEKDGPVKRDLIEKLKKLSARLGEIGLDTNPSKSLKLRVQGCMADSDNHRGVSPDGNIMKCEHYIDDRIVGHLESNEEDKAMLDDWKKPMTDGEFCPDCPARPSCYRLENCPVSHPCTFDEREQLLLRNIRTMKSLYEYWKHEEMGLVPECENNGIC